MNRKLYLHQRQLMVVALGTLVVGGGWFISSFRENTTNYVAHDAATNTVYNATSGIACSKYIPSMNMTICITKDNLCLPGWPHGDPKTPCTIVLP